MQTSRLLELAATISESTASLHKWYAQNQVAFPSFNAHSTQVFPQELSAAQDAVLDATAELHDLLLKPVDLIFRHGGHNNMVPLQAISRFRIPQLFGPDEQSSFAQLARSTGLGEQAIRRLLRHAMTMRVFAEPSPGVVAHTAASKLLREPHMQDWMSVACEEMWPAALRVVDALTQWPDSPEPTQTAFALANRTENSIYQIVGSDPARAARFAHAMEAYTSSQGFDVAHILDNYEWEKIGSGLVVDVGGSRGHIAVALAQRFPSLRVLVQDMEHVVTGASTQLPVDVGDRVQFMAHDFLAVQPVRAKLYYFRWIFHNWSDKYAIQILRHLIPSLQKGAQVLIHDRSVPEPGRAAHGRTKDLCAVDLNMLAVFNGKERNPEEWRRLFSEADSRFEFQGITEPEGSALAIIEACWAGDDV